MLSMREVRDALKTQLEKLGYKVSVFKSIEMQFDLGGSGHAGKIELRSANAKRFEVAITARENDLNVPSIQHFETRSMHIARKRFTKRMDVIPGVLEWISGAVTTNAHLDELLHPDRPLPEPYKYADGTYVHMSMCTYPGMASEASVIDIVATNGRLVVHTVFDPSKTPYFLMTMGVRQTYGGSTLHMVTDGDVWYPVRRSGSGSSASYRVFLDESVIERLSKLNQNDRALIAAEIGRYIDVNLNEDDTGAMSPKR